VTHDYSVCAHQSSLLSLLICLIDYRPPQPTPPFPRSSRAPPTLPLYLQIVVGYFQKGLSIGDQEFGRPDPLCSIGE
jgi:hypothetical protein